ncbi:helix-turn-helix transcriptional regulator [Psychroserpens sp.]|uniref:helix-turn-helix domain-containing protein n=1 Tax=Psychroserpens sp. TaxID=2020870 RepID=UPI002B26D955|nr:helix-turn-helix transcriptional regulator [Psychroserpens sp.]
MKDKELQGFVLGIGKRIRAFRKEQKMTQLDLGIKSDIEENAIQRLETGRTSPTVKTLFKVAKGLGVEVRELM